MIKEFAVDPSLYSSDYEWQILFQHFGYHKGRVISKFPNDWDRIAYENLKELYRRKRIKEIEKSRMIERLNRIRKYLIDFSRTYDSNLEWFQNSLKEHQQRAFAAIISKINPNSQANILKLEDINEDNEYWRTPVQIIVERDFSKIAPLLKNLFVYAKKVIFVDKHFHPTLSRFTAPLKNLLDTIFNTNNQVRNIEYHLAADPRESLNQFQNCCDSYIKPLLPRGKEIKFIRWESQSINNPVAGGQNLHPRLILTDLGGVNIEWGLDNGQPRDKTLVNLLDPETFKVYWNLHHKETSTYVFSDEIIIKGN